MSASRIDKLRGIVRSRSGSSYRRAESVPRIPWSSSPKLRNLHEWRARGFIPGPAVWNSVIESSAHSLRARLSIFDEMEAHGVVRNPKTYTLVAAKLSPDKPMSPHVLKTLLRTMDAEAWPPQSAFLKSAILVAETPADAKEIYAMCPTPTPAVRAALAERLQRDQNSRRPSRLHEQRGSGGCGGDRRG
eukprot:TRINITY_DN4663_c0_g1_i1.p1 TRINITY_DN4663_c0_g1~~TRINITY_DN4663_c0_g1_i1.p1  ORF type:complete len:189 (+),score=9.60 TRINITY_DN4663_c0_g1_i1:167-733(+)